MGAQKFNDEEAELKGQRMVLNHSIGRLQQGIRNLLTKFKEKGIDAPQSPFPVEESG
ncbi:MAG: hypothetical protein FJY95_08030 [Candidatus Handelsmanbacteria bacterium]|nr:hypothetical protein [Candidatus Handelsmanbacteria bacterium]